MPIKILIVPIACAFAMLISLGAHAQQYRGINLAGGEFNGNKAGWPGVYGKNYIYPGPKEMAAFAEMGATVFRLPVRWERVQAETGAPLSEAEMRRIDAVIEFAASRKMSVIIDVHNFGKYKSQSIGKGVVTTADFATLWKLIAQRYRNNRGVIFGLMNEPFDIDAETWATIAMSATQAIRKAGANNLILVPGTAWSGAHSWRKPVKGVSNATAMAKFNDPGDNFAFEFHQYFDAYSSGASPVCVTPAEAEKRIMVATKWLEEVGARGFLGEFALSGKTECLDILNSVLNHIKNHRQWIGWAYWASSAWFGDYPFNVFPFQKIPPPQLPVLKDYLSKPR